MKKKIKSRAHRYNINRPKSRHGRKYSKYKRFLSMMVFTYIKQHLSNIWNSIHEKLSNTKAELKKCVAYKKACSHAFRGNSFFAADKISSKIWQGKKFQSRVDWCFTKCFVRTDCYLDCLKKRYWLIHFEKLEVDMLLLIKVLDVSKNDTL